MADALASRMRADGKMAGVVSLYIGYSKNLGGFARRTTLLSPTDDSEVLLNVLMELYEHHAKDLPIRRIGISFGQLSVASHQQLNLFEDDKEQVRRRDLQKTVDMLQRKFGKNAVLRGSSLLKESTVRERNKYIGGHRK